ncbi:MAG: hypothetical protein ACSHXL_04210 [Bacteroidota bacterium]
MNLKKLFLIGLLLISSIFACSSNKEEYISPKNAISQSIKIAKRNCIDSFEIIKLRYDTLIPILKELFIAHNDLKWGVVDSCGKVIVPFMCDGVKEISKTEGIASIYESNQSLHTGVPRYTYYGNYFYFTKNGISLKEMQSFNILITMRADIHHERFIIETGPYYYLPDTNGDSIIDCSFRFGGFIN